MKKYISILVFLAALLALVSFAAAQEPCRTPAGKPCVLVQQAAVAQAQGLEFLGINYSTNIGDVLAGVYRFALGLVGIAALIMFVLGGVTYMTAADSQDRVKQGQAFMRNAIFGLVLALLSYLILYTINPDIVKRLDLDIKPVKEAEVKLEKMFGLEEFDPRIKTEREKVGTQTIFIVQPTMVPGQSIVQWKNGQRNKCSIETRGKGIFRENLLLTAEKRSSVLIYECIIPGG